MAIETSIEWCRSTFNPWWGCTKVSPGCNHCYAERAAHRFGTGWGPDQSRRFFGDKHWNEPRKWNEKARLEQQADPKAQWRVFCASMGDVFDNAVPQEHRDRLWALIRETPHLTWLVLTKRIGNAAKMLPADWGDGYPNVWLGASIVNQDEAERDIPKLLNIPATVRFLSMEPLLGPVDLTGINARDYDSHSFDALSGGAVVTDCNGREGGIDFRPLDWVIVGGESGPNARPMALKWARSLRDQCAAAGVPFLFKQWGEWLPTNQNPVACRGSFRFYSHPGDCVMMMIGKNAAGRLLDGVIHDGYPT